MAHDKVYGICEDKCRVEVYAKTQLTGNLICSDIAELGFDYDGITASVATIKAALDTNGAAQLTAQINTADNAANYPVRGASATLIIMGLMVVFLTTDNDLYVKSLIVDRGFYRETAWKHVA